MYESYSDYTYYGIDYGVTNIFSNYDEGLPLTYSLAGNYAPATGNYIDLTVLTSGSNTNICKPCPCIKDKDDQDACGTGTVGSSGINSCTISSDYKFSDSIGSWEFDPGCQYAE